MIFKGQATSAKRIAQTLQALPADKLKVAMEKRGLKDVSIKKLSEVLAGKDKVGMKHGELKNVVEALQEVGVARQARTASQMVMTASQEARTVRGVSGSSRDREVLFNNTNEISGARALEEGDNHSTSSAAEESRGILARMRGVVGQMQRANRDEGAPSAEFASLQKNPEEHLASQDQGGIRGLRFSMRRALGIQESPIVPGVVLPGKGNVLKK